MRFTKGFLFATVEAANEFEEQRTRFFTENEMLDEYMEARLDLANLPFLERVLVIRDKTNERRLQRRRKAQILNNNNNNLTRAPDVLNPTHGQEQQEEQRTLLSPRTSSLNDPWWLSPWVFWPASIFLLSWPLRMLAEYKTGYVHLQVCKLFGTNYLSPSSINYTGPLTRTSTMDSHELSMANRQNYVVVPSYSEAILLDPYNNTQLPNSGRSQVTRNAQIFEFSL
ncbi:unnamed protein product [Meloidogyne enterolobii]|uniref:Uncharacterized protein n=1 Tax=Meloidogyne enterolobii TaxID=390850 RepID=A0ACB1AMT8_MELEN